MVVHGSKITDRSRFFSRTEASQILQFWYQVEFFIPFDLQRQVLESRDAKLLVRGWSREALCQADLSLWRPAGLPPGRRLIGFDVYFGIFDKSLLAEVAQRMLCKVTNPDDAWEQEERCALEGATCIAKIKTGPAGEPLLEEISVSTAPWALGRIQSVEGGAAKLDFGAFQDSVDRLKARLRQFRAEWSAVDDSSQRKQAECESAPLSGEELLALLAIFKEWAGINLGPQHQDSHVLVIQAKIVDSRSKKTVVTSKSEATQVLGKLSEEKGAGTEVEKNDGDDEDVDILNSFFIKDISRAATLIEKGERCPALEAYLTALPPGERLDLYCPEGQKHILKTISPKYLPTAHWLDEPAHAMSLMQQFAINGLLERLKSGGVFSVNGPPGTGKTTLLRDVFAELITRRAGALARLPNARDAFDESISVDFQGKQPCRHVSRLRETLTGFEMVVASSNNAAVENLSKDLPKAKSLGKTGKTPWRDTQGGSKVGYLKAVACNIASRKANGDYVELAPDDTPWGLIACALGNRRNRSTFADRLTRDAGKLDKPPKEFNPAFHQSLWAWRDKYQGPSFAAAKKAFLDTDRAVRQRVAALERYAALLAQLDGQTLKIFTSSAEDQVTRSRQAMVDARTALQNFDQELGLCANQLASLREDARLIEQDRPSWWVRWFQQSRDQKCRAELSSNHEQQRKWLARKREIETNRLNAERQVQYAVNAYSEAQQYLVARKNEWCEFREELKTLASMFSKAKCPKSAAALEEPHWQIDGCWRDDALNKLRSELFVAALGVHEAWLAEVLKSGGGFGSNVVAIGYLLSGERLQRREHAMVIWQSLFMIVPVVSSTFASIASQFHDLEPNSLGWLFIDEAGQATPQQAVGALWRAKRAVVVGDPLQIEPVFNVPIKLAEALAQAIHLPATRQVMPHQVSVQNLADLANAVGALVTTSSESQWIGSPLRVHRRCVDPMFTIANTIAYQGKMIFFAPDNLELRRPPADSLDLGVSAWVDICGGMAKDKQVVQEQVDLVCQAVVSLYQRTGELPALYIISPFRRIKEALTRKLADADIWQTRNCPSTMALREWCRARIGTVHTFQGKEESLVWMVLGCDALTRGAAVWAASKPNLFNVALTRAKHRFFVIGDERLWAGLPYFSLATENLLPRIQPEDFLQRVRNGTTGTFPTQ